MDHLPFSVAEHLRQEVRMAEARKIVHDVQVTLPPDRPCWRCLQRDCGHIPRNPDANPA